MGYLPAVKVKYFIWGKIKESNKIVSNISTKNGHSEAIKQEILSEGKFIFLKCFQEKKELNESYQKSISFADDLLNVDTDDESVENPLNSNNFSQYLEEFKSIYTSNYIKM